MTNKIKLEFACGCIGTKTKIVINSRLSRIKSCPEHGEPIVAKHIFCVDCGTPLKTKAKGILTQRCEACRIQKIVTRNREYAGKFSRNGDHTTAELKFIKTLSERKAAGYLQGLELRERWDGLDKDAIFRAAKKQAGVTV